jgi:hypothetical protein
MERRGAMKFTTLKQIRAIVEGGVEAPPETMSLSRRQDDSDGSTDPEQSITVSVSCDGDMWIGQGSKNWLRFRNFIGGGDSLRTHNALRILIEAIRLDNEERPQPPEQPAQSTTTKRK